MSRVLALLFVMLSLTACDRLGIPDPAAEAASRDAEGKAIGGACRHSGRALEDCFVLNPAASKAAVFAGWKEMNDYMLENKIEVVQPALPPTGVLSRRARSEPEEPAAAAEPAAEEEQSRPSRRRARSVEH